MKHLLKSAMCNSVHATFALLITLIVIPAISFESAMAQGVIGNAIRNKVQQKVIEKAEGSIDEAFDEESREQQKDDDQDGEAENGINRENNSTADDESEEIGNRPSQSKPKLETKSQYDFVPGDKVLFFEDFSQDAIGDFPALWTTTGSGEVKTVNLASGHWLHMNAQDQVYNLMKDLNLPENFIFEFDLIAQPGEEDGHFDFYLTLYNSSNDFLDDALYPGISGTHVTISDQNWQVRGYHNEKDRMFDGETSLVPVETNGLSHVIIWVQKARMRIYHKGSKVIDLPTVMYTPTNYNRLRFSLWSSQGTPLISNVRFTSASPDTRSKLLTEGKLISYGIYFDVNSDKIKPESRGAINDIAKVLAENPSIRIKIEGHTDGDGDNASNLDLSKRRAKSVKYMLTSEFSVADDRIETDGYGESKPIGNNNSSEGKAQNRRVEFIKL